LKEHSGFLVNFKDVNFSFCYISQVAFALSFAIPYTFIPAYAVAHNISRGDAALLVSVMGIAIAAGKVVINYISQLCGILKTFRLTLLCCGISTLCWLFCQTLHTLLAYVVLFGLNFGAALSLLPVLCAKLFGEEKCGTILGALYTSYTFGK
jgi:MFS family permease